MIWLRKWNKLTANFISLQRFDLRSSYFQSLQSLTNLFQFHALKTSPMCTSFQWTNNKNTLPSVLAFYYTSSSSSYFTVEGGAKTLYRVSSCTPVSFPAKITWFGQKLLCYRVVIMKTMWEYGQQFQYPRPSLISWWKICYVIEMLSVCFFLYYRQRKQTLVVVGEAKSKNSQQQINFL